MELQSAVNQLKSEGHKLTPQRVEILRAVMQASGAVTAQEVLAEVQLTHAYISLDTVYRNLQMLTETGLVNQVNLQNKATAKFEFQGVEHHHHAICLDCKKSFCLSVCPLPPVAPKPADDSGFKVVRHAYEVYGYCSGCQAEG